MHESALDRYQRAVRAEQDRRSTRPRRAYAVAGQVITLPLPAVRPAPFTGSAGL